MIKNEFSMLEFDGVSDNIIELSKFLKKIQIILILYLEFQSSNRKKKNIYIIK